MRAIWLFTPRNEGGWMIDCMDEWMWVRSWRKDGTMNKGHRGRVATNQSINVQMVGLING